MVKNKKGNSLENDLITAMLIILLIVFIGLYVGHSYLKENSDVYYSNFSSLNNNLSLNSGISIKSLDGNTYKSLVINNTNQNGSVDFDGTIIRPFENLNITNNNLSEYDFEMSISYKIGKNESGNSGVNAWLLLGNKYTNQTAEQLFNENLTYNFMGQLERGLLVGDKNKNYVTMGGTNGSTIILNFDVFPEYKYLIMRISYNTPFNGGKVANDVQLIRFNNIDDLKDIAFVFKSGNAGLDSRGYGFDLNKFYNYGDLFKINYIKAKIYS